MVEKIDTELTRIENQKVATLKIIDDIGKDRTELIPKWEAIIENKRATTVSVGDSLGLLFGSVRQIADLIDGLVERVEALEKA